MIRVNFELLDDQVNKPVGIYREKIVQFLLELATIEETTYVIRS